MTREDENCLPQVLKANNQLILLQRIRTTNECKAHLKTYVLRLSFITAYRTQYQVVAGDCGRVVKPHKITTVLGIIITLGYGKLYQANCQATPVMDAAHTDRH